MSDILLTELEKKDKCILVLEGFLKKRPISGLYLNFIEKEKNRRPGMFNIICSDTQRTLFDIFLYLVYQLNYPMEYIYIPCIDGESVISIAIAREKSNYGSLKNMFEDFEKKAWEKDYVEIVWDDPSPDVQVVAYKDHIKLTLIEYVLLHPELLEIFINRLKSDYFSLRDFVDDRYTQRIQHILLKPIKFFGVHSNVGSSKN